MKIKINGKEHALKFGLNSARLYCKDRDIELWEYEKDLSKLDFENFNTIEQVEILGTMIYTAIKSVDENTEVKLGEIIDNFSDAEFLKSIFKEFLESNPKSDGKESPTKKK